MTTYFDPTGTPGRKYGSTTVEVTASGSTAGGATAIPAETGWTVALVTNPDSDNRAVKLPADAEVGDVVEVYQVATPGVGLLIFPPSGESLGSPGGSSVTINQSGGGRLFRKATATTWVATFG